MSSKMKKFFSKIENKIKNKTGGSAKDAETDRIHQLLENERKTLESQPQGHRGAVKKNGASSAPDGEEGVTYDNVPDSEGGKYHVIEVTKVQLPGPTSSKKYDLKIEFLDNSSSSKSSSVAWAIDSMLIDEDMLYLEDEEADKMYQELKQRSFRRRNMEEKENRLNIAMQAAQEEEERAEDEEDSPVAQAKNQQKLQ